MCGASSEQGETYDLQNQFFQESLKEQAASYAQDQGLLKTLQGVYQPIFQAGPSQEGFSPEEKASLETGVIDRTATNYQTAARAVNEQLMAQGGGNIAIPSGATAQIQAGVAQSAAQEQSREEGQITQANWSAGYQNWLNAGKGMFGISDQLNPLGYSNAATSAGSESAKTANQIAEQSNSWLNAAIGAAGTIGGAYLGK